MQAPRNSRSGEDAGPLRVVHTPLYLGNLSPAQRIVMTTDASSNRRPDTESVTPGPEVKIFTIPAHLVEELWLEEIPRMLAERTAGSPTAPAAAWRSLGTLAFMLSTIDDGFSEQVEAVLQVASATRSPIPTNDIWDVGTHARAELPGRCAWLNLDETPQFAAMRRRTDREPHVCVRIEPGEGLVWDPVSLAVADGSAADGTEGVRLLLLSGVAS